MTLLVLPEISPSVALLNSGDDANEQDNDDENDSDNVNGVFHVDPT